MTIVDRFRILTKKSSITQHNHDLLLSKEVFRRIVDRERDRANRTGEIFSLIVFLSQDSKDIEESLVLLADSLSHRMRSIDVVGWLDSTHVGVLLPETDSAGARLFVNKISHGIHSDKIFKSYEIITYPSDKLTNPEMIALHVLPEKAGQTQNRVSYWSIWRFTQPKGGVDYTFYRTKKILKRGFDIFSSTVFLLIFSPVFLAIAIIIKIVSPGPVFYKQQRIGFAGQTFTFLKFRTMCLAADAQEHKQYLAQLIHAETDGSEANKPMAKLDHGPQLIPFGNLLRKSCLDELPQLINVLRGEMSLVGPRPPIPYEVKEYHPWHRGRFNAIPGMTGLWQVSGKNKLSFKEMVRLDILYARERSFWMDIKILFRTPMAIVKQLMDSMKREDSTINEGA